MSQTFSPTDIASKRLRSRYKTRLGSVFDGEHVFEVGYSVRGREVSEKRTMLPPGDPETKVQLSRGKNQICQS